MAVEIAGQTAGAERDAAESLKARLEPSLRPLDKLLIVAGAKCYGQKREDIDLLLIGQFAPGFRIPSEALTPDVRDRDVYVKDFIMVIEVKDHDSANVRFEGNQVRTRYSDGWRDASKQVFNQVFSVKNFLQKNLRLDYTPRVFKALWLRNIPRDGVPRQATQVLASDLVASAFFRVILEQNLDGAIRNANGAIQIASSEPGRHNTLTEAAAFFTKRMEPGSLDRKRLEILCKKLVRDLKSQQYLDKLGTQALIFRGRGGAGKTLRLLNIGNRAREESGARVLLLTYNIALVADIRRLLAVLGVSREIDAGAIHVRSRDSYLMGLLEVCGLPPADKSNMLEDYTLRKTRLLEVLDTMTTISIRKNEDAINNPEYFAWDLVLIDEGQDWPEADRDILLKIFGAERLIIADGVDQFVHSQPKRCNWNVAQPHQIVNFHRSLRLKTNLCRFAERFALETGLEWDMEPNDEVSGGRIKIALNGYTVDLHRQLMTQHQAAGNHPIDSLFCVTGAMDARYQAFPKRLAASGAKIWDGTQQDIRQDYPRELAQHRIVKYESCRGLEGWTVVCLDLDAFFDRKLNEGHQLKADLFDSPEDAALRHAARWCLIPFTRAIDTLVLQLDEQSALWKRLAPIARAHQDFVEIIRS